MFSRRHPFLFFSLVLSAIGAAVILGSTLIMMAGGAWFYNRLDILQSSPRGNVGIIELTGIITSSKKTIEQIKKFREDDRIKAIVLRIDSPGGGVGPSQEIYREIVKTKKAKKMVASLGAVAASGGYYAASAADGIMANPGTLTGSIGVIMEYANIQDLMKKIGLTPVVIKSGEFKDMGSPVRQLKEKERAILQELADEIHGQFVRDVAKGRNLAEEEVIGMADGRVFTGEKGVELKLVDRLGNLDDAVSWAGKMAGLAGDKIVPVYPPEDRVDFFREMFQSLFENIHIAGPVSDYFRYVVN